MPIRLLLLAPDLVRLIKTIAGFASEVAEIPPNGISPIAYAMKVPNASIQ